MPEIKQLKLFIEQHQNGFSIPQCRVGAVATRMHQVSGSSGLGQFIHFVDLLKFISLYQAPETIGPGVGFGKMFGH
jgi:hypothetical protein